VEYDLPERRDRSTHWCGPPDRACGDRYRVRSDLYVNAGAPAGGDGRKGTPFKTIREAVSAARVKTTIHIAEGTYVEELDTIVARDRVSLKGSTVLAVDHRKLPTGGTQHAAIVRPHAAIPAGQALFQIRAQNVSKNDFLRNGSDPSVYPSNSPNTGAYFLLNDSTASDATQGARIDADIHGNTFMQNIWYGVAVGQRIEPNKRLTGYAFEGTFERNRYCGNGLNVAALDFRHIVVTHGGGTQRFRFGRGSTYAINAALDPLAGIDFDYDHPALDPDPHDYTNPTEHEDAEAPLGNKLLFNGTPVPNSPPGQPHIKPGPPTIGNCPPSPSWERMRRN